MSKKGDTQSLVKQAADALLHEGVRPTQQNIRERIGSGSITTINKALNQWWQELGERLKANTSHPMIPDPVAESASKLWHQAVAYADARLEKERLDLESRYQAQVTALEQHEQKDEQELKQLREQCLSLLQDKERLSDEKYRYLKQIADLENQLLKASSEAGALKRDLKQQGIMTGKGSGGDSVEAFIEQQVTNRFLKEENKTLKKQLDVAINENAALKYELARLKQAKQ
ncbi:DNA-binding protein [Neptuniibacter sp. CAU 1671]|uniref:DNA-binding protein n=1 Tax=Neptuniibacter sp. CAU 1671 TaxID=3032593 RepID=UPI0023DC8325|nr:DNA-binding protein [Neptuniibacter sp. CAU 1671]MDF2180522.1 DNA-binding protein [Neptuniibacter sp. CAU 1671]